MKKSIAAALLLLSTPLYAQDCASLCNVENWVMPGTEFITSAIENSEEINALDESGTPPIIHAVRFATPSQMSALIAAGADVNIQTPNGWTPLIHAISLNKLRIIVALLEAGADVNIQNNDGQTLLHFMAQRVVPIELYPYVLAAKPDLALQDMSGQTAYDHAVMNEVMGQAIAPLLSPIAQ